MYVTLVIPNENNALVLICNAELILQTDILPPGRVNTVRTPDQKGNTDDAMLQDKIQRQYQGLSNALYYLLNPGKGGPDNRARTWEAFANHFVNKVNSAQGFQPPSVSLESWHDQIHGLVGSGRSAGHMNDPAVASVSLFCAMLEALLTSWFE